MRNRYVYIGGGAAVLLAGILASRSGVFGDRSAEPAPETVTLTATAIDAPPELAAELGRLNDTLTAREAELAELRTTLAVRDQVVASLNARVADQDEALDALRLDLAAREAEVADLRRQLTELQDQGLDRALTAMKREDGDPSATRLASARAETAALAADFDAKMPTLPIAVRMVGPADASADAAVQTDDAPMVEVHFDFASASLTPGGQAHAAAAAVTLADMTLSRVRVVGHTDRVGSPAANRRLAEKRARAVVDFLVAAGLSADLIEADAMGEEDSPVFTDDGVAEPLNRTVAIIAVPMPTT